MKKTLLILFLLPLVASSQIVTFGSGKKLDSLLEKSGRIRYSGNHFFFQKTETPLRPLILIHPDSLFKRQRSLMQLPPISQYVPYTTYLNDRENSEKIIADLQTQITKLTQIAENNVENSGTAKNSLDAITAFLECFTALIAAIGGLWGFFKYLKKKEQQKKHKHKTKVA